MKQHTWFRAGWYAVNFLLVVSLLALLYAVVGEYSTREYLRGFAEAVVPLSASPERKVEAILAWMQYGPERRPLTDQLGISRRNPEDTLNYRQLLQVCGTATNAFVNLAESSGLQARRLLLLTPGGRAKHVVAEVLINGRWAVVDPAFHTVFRDRQGGLLIGEQLRDPGVFADAISRIPRYPPEYNYEFTAHVRLAKIPLIGRPLQRVLGKAFPGWDESRDWTLLLERESFALVVKAGLALLLCVVARLVLSWYGSRRLGITRVRLRDNLQRATHALFTGTR